MCVYIGQYNSPERVYMELKIYTLQDEYGIYKSIYT